MILQVRGHFSRVTCKATYHQRKLRVGFGGFLQQIGENLRIFCSLAHGWRRCPAALPSIMETRGGNPDGLGAGPNRRLAPVIHRVVGAMVAIARNTLSNDCDFQCAIRGMETGL